MGAMATVVTGLLLDTEFGIERVPLNRIGKQSANTGKFRGSGVTPRIFGKRDGTGVRRSMVWFRAASLFVFLGCRFFRVMLARVKNSIGAGFAPRYNHR